MLLVRCDKDLITQVLYNLMSNAIKFVEPEKGLVQIKVYTDLDEIQIVVSDNGKGVPDELKELIFDKFFQAKNQTIKKPQGSGLGLAISKRIVELHGGKIWVENTPGGGARFNFTLPMR
jgi:signal transduction histidine kinase